MGGIAGIIHFRGDPPERGDALALSAALARRGPDDRGVFAEGPVCLVHRRLMTSDKEIRLPVVDESFVLALDGRLYGGDEGQAAVRAWRSRGPEGLADLDGSFAMAIWDRRRHTLWLVRDRLGCRPLYWTRRGHQVAFASEIPPLLDLPWVSRSVCSDHLAEYLSFRYVHAPRTLFREIHAVPPGHVVRISTADEWLDCWWTPPWCRPGEGQTDPDEAAREVDRLLRASVRKRLDSRSKVAVLLSGGLDSSAILHHACEAGPTPPLTFTVKLADDPFDETALAARVAKVMGAEHHLVPIDHRDLIDTIERCTRVMGQPLPSAAAVLQMLLFEQIRPSARAVLSGDGGDEVLGGRVMGDLARRMFRNHLLGLAPKPIEDLARQIAGRVGRADLAASPADFGRDRKVGGSSVFQSIERVSILRDPALARPGIRRSVLDPLYQEVDTDPINAVLHVWQRGWLPEDSLARSDRMAAHLGMEVRYPLLDRELITYLAGLPGPLKVRRRGPRVITKWPLRRAMRKRLPRPLLHRPKRSLPNPLDHWLRTAGQDFLADAVDGIARSSATPFEPSAVRKLAEEHTAGTQNHGLKIWTVCLFHVWQRALGV